MRDSWDNMFEEVPASFEARMKETLSALEEKPKIRRFRFGTGALVAAALLVAVLGGTALATDFFGLKSLTVTDPDTQQKQEYYRVFFVRKSGVYDMWFDLAQIDRDTVSEFFPIAEAKE